MIISFGGNAGSGKSTIAKMLAEKLGWPRHYIGGIRREKAKERGLSLHEYNKMGELDPSTDLEVDLYQKTLGETSDNFIIEGRTSWFLIPNSLKIFLDVDEKIGAERVLNELKKSNERNESVKMPKNLKEMIEINQQRKTSDILRYEKYYQKNVYDPQNFDLVIDTSKLSPEEVFDKVYAYIKEKLK